MRRMQLFEFEDQPWLPGWVRDALTDHLAQLFTAPAVAPLHDVLAEHLGDLIDHDGSDRVLDLCSGAGGPLPAVLPLVEERLERPVSVTLTDRYPHQGLDADGVGDGRLRLEREPVDARSVPPELEGVRTLFNAVHHFRPTEVARILRSATFGDRSVLVAEPFERRLGLAARLAVGGLRDGWRRARGHHGAGHRVVALHVVLPVVLGWDGAASVLRGYRAEELLTIAEGAAPSVRWRAERVDLPWGGLTVLVGVPGRSPAG